MTEQDRADVSALTGVGSLAAHHHPLDHSARSTSTNHIGRHRGWRAHDTTLPPSNDSSQLTTLIVYALFATRLEQRAAGSQPGSTSDLLALAEQIATFGPNARATGRVWSSRGSAERARKFGSVGLLLSGLVTVVSAVTPSIGSRLNAIDDVVPLPVHRAVELESDDG